MRLDLIIGLLVSVALHATFLLAFNKHAPKSVAVIEEKAEVILIEMPPLEPEKNEEVHEKVDDAPISDFAPPSIVDTPSATVTAFTQQIQPPPPPGLTQTSASLTIPVFKPGTQFGKGIDDLVSVADLDQPPNFISRIQPTYPYEMKRQQISGKVKLEFIIDKTGNVSDVIVVSSSRREFEDPAKVAALKWKFTPNKKAGKPVNVRATIEIPFNVDE